MDMWTLLAVTIGCSAVVFQLLIFLGLFVKYRKLEHISERTPPPRTINESTSGLSFTDPYTGKAINLERVSNASSLRSTRSVGFIEYNKSEDGSTRGRVTPLFDNASISSARLNRSMTSLSSIPGDEKLKTSVNPIFEEEQLDIKQLNVNPISKEEQDIKQLNVNPIYKEEQDIKQLNVNPIYEEERHDIKANVNPKFEEEPQQLNKVDPSFKKKSSRYHEKKPIKLRANYPKYPSRKLH